MTKPHEFTIERWPGKDGKVDTKLGTCVARAPGITVTVEPRRAKVCRMFRRHMIILNSGGRREEMVCAELDGVFLYIRGNEIKMTKRTDW